MENFSSESFKAYYDHKRFPTTWQAIVGCAIMQFAAILPLIIIEVISLGNTSQLFRTSFGEDMFNGVLSQFFAVLIIPLLFLLIFKKDMRATLRLKKNIDAVQIILLLFISLGIYFASQIINAIFVSSLASFMGEPSEVGTITTASNISQLLFEIVIVAGLPCICEEIFFRGFVMRAFERYSPVLAVVLSSVAFAVMHGNIQQILYAFILGLILGTVVMLTDSLFAGTVMHFTLNAFSVIISYPPIYSQYENIATNYELPFLLTFVGALPLIAVIAFIIFIIYTRKKNKQKYNKAFVSEMEFPSLMPKSAGWERTLTVIGWIVFIGINLYSMFMLWYYDILTGVANQL